MKDFDRQPDVQSEAGHSEAADASAPEPSAGFAAPPSADDISGAPEFDESLVEEVSTLIDDGRNYAQAEIRFQKTRAKLAGRSLGIAILCLSIALILLHIAFLALAVGLVIALAPIVTIWGAIAIVFGCILLLAALLAAKAWKRGKLAAALYSSKSKEGGE